MPRYTFRNRETGESFSIPWHDTATAPTWDDVELYRRQQRQPREEERGRLGQAWDWLNKPLSDAPSRWARQAVQAVPTMDSVVQKMNDDIPGFGTAVAMGRGFLEGATEGAGDLASSLTSPLSLGLTALSGGAWGAGKLGLGGTARALSVGEQALGLGLAGHGATQVGEGVMDTGRDLYNDGFNWNNFTGHAGEIGSGLVQTAGGLLGARAGGERIGRLNAARKAAQDEAARVASLPKPITDPSRLLPERASPRFYGGQAGIADASVPYREHMASIDNPFMEGTLGPAQKGEVVDIPPQIAAEYGLGANRRPAAPIVEPVQPEIYNPVGDPNVVPLGQVEAPLGVRPDPALGEVPFGAVKPERGPLPTMEDPFAERGVRAGVIRDIANEELNLPRDAAGNPVRANIPLEERGIGAPAAQAPAAATDMPALIAEAKRLLGDARALNEQALGNGVRPVDLRNELRRFVGENEAQVAGPVEDPFAPLLEAEAANAQPVNNAAPAIPDVAPPPLNLNGLIEATSEAPPRAATPAPPVVEPLPVVEPPVVPEPPPAPPLRKFPARGTDEGPVGISEIVDDVEQAKALLANKKAFNAQAKAAGLKAKDFRAALKQFVKDEGGWYEPGRELELLKAGGQKVKGAVKGAADAFNDLIKSSGIEKSLPEAVPILRDWMGKRAAAATRGVIEGRKFRGYDKEDVASLIDMQENPAKYPDVAKYFEGAKERALDADLALNLKENALPQIWENSPDEINAAFAKMQGEAAPTPDPLAAPAQKRGRVSLKPAFSLKSVIENYRQGVELGLTPKYKNVSELVNWYERSLNKAIADRELFFTLKDKGLIRLSGNAPYGWKDLSSDFFPSFGKKGEARLLWKAHPDMVDAISNYVTERKGFFKKAGQVVQTSKDIALSSGMLPGTAVNAHGFNILARHATTKGAKGLAGATLEGIGMMLNTGADNPVARGIEQVAPWKSARAVLEENLPHAPEFVEGGLNLSTEGFKFGEARHTNPFLKVHGKFFEDPLFQNMIPALKLKHARGMADDFVKGGMERKAAVREASRIANEMYGGINTDMMFRDKSFQDVMRTALIAPDWLESNYRVGKGLATAAGKGAEKGPYRQMAYGFMGAYVMANIANKAMSGHYMYENAPGHTLQIDTGSKVDSEGKKKVVYFNPFGTAFDAPRLAADTAAAAAKGDLSAPGRIIRNRLSMPAASVGNLLYNEDWRERPLGGKDAYGREIPFGKQALNYSQLITDPFTPQYIGAIKELMLHDISPIEASMGAVEAPLRFASTPRQKRTSSRTRRRSRTRGR